MLSKVVSHLCKVDKFAEDTEAERCRPRSGRQEVLTGFLFLFLFLIKVRALSIAVTAIN